MFEKCREFCNSRTGKCFFLGVAAGVAAVKLVKAKKTREACVKGLSKGMLIYKDVQENIQNIKEDAEDLCFEAKVAAGVEAEDEAQEQ